MPTTETAKVIRIIDGDTLVIQDYRRIRLLGCNAPEIKHKYGAISTQFAIERLLDKDITLEYEINKIDKQMTNFLILFLSLPNQAYALL